MDPSYFCNIIFSQTKLTDTFTHTHAHTHTHIHIYTYTHIHIYTYIYLYIFIYLSFNIYYVKGLIPIVLPVFLPVFLVTCYSSSNAPPITCPPTCQPAFLPVPFHFPCSIAYLSLKLSPSFFLSFCFLASLCFWFSASLCLHLSLLLFLCLILHLSPWFFVSCNLFLQFFSLQNFSVACLVNYSLLILSLLSFIIYLFFTLSHSSFNFSFPHWIFFSYLFSVSFFILPTHFSYSVSF